MYAEPTIDYALCYAHVPQLSAASSTDAKALEVGLFARLWIGAAVRSTAFHVSLVSTIFLLRYSLN